MKSKLALISVLACVLALTAACGGRRDDGAASGRLTIATGNTTGVYYVLGGAMAEQIDDNLEGTKATSTETAASVDNIEGLMDGSYDVAFCLMDTAVDAVEGNESFDEPQDVQALLRLYPNYTQVVARKDSGIETIADLKGKRVSTGSPNSGTEVIAHRLMEAAGVDPENNIDAQRLALPETTKGLADGDIDAMFWSGGIPTSGITELFSTAQADQFRLIDLSPELPKLQDEYGDIYEEGSIPADTYDQPADTPSVVVQNVLLVKKGFDDEMAGKLIELIFDTKAELAKASPAAEDISLETALDTAPIPLHPVAEQKLIDLGATQP